MSRVTYERCKVEMGREVGRCGACVCGVCVCVTGGGCVQNSNILFGAKESVLSKNHKLYMTYYIVLIHASSYYKTDILKSP